MISPKIKDFGDAKNPKDFLASKKSQAALEFIMTYGWAILVVLVAIGALAYFGVLNPDQFLPAKCTLSSGIACLDHRVQGSSAAANGRVTIRIQNSLGYDIDTVNVRAGDCGNSVSNCFGTCPTTLANGNGQTYIIDCVAGSAVLGTSKYNKQLNVSYRITETLIDHNNAGRLTARVE